MGLTVELLAGSADMPVEDLLLLLKAIREQPENYLDDRQWESLATAFLEESRTPKDETIKLREHAPAYAIYGANGIEQGALRQIDGQLLAKVENHPNFAWKETWNGEEVIVHRKGATPGIG